MSGIGSAADTESNSLVVEPWSPDHLHARDNPLQSALWAEYKGRTGQEPHAFRVTYREETFHLLVLLSRIAEKRYAGYLPWAPNLQVYEEEQGALLEKLGESLRAHLPEGTVYLRFDLPWESPYEEEPPTQQLRELRMNFTTSRKLLRKAASDIQPVDTIVLDTQSSDEALLQGMHKKTRYNIRLARDRGVEVYEGDPEQELDQWYALYRETMERKGLTVHGRKHFEALFDADARTGSEQRVSLYFARSEGHPAAAIITAQTDRYTLYLYGASNPALRSKMPAYALQWSAIRRARENGSAVYDLYGIPSDRTGGHPMHGLFRFKSGFGGRMVRRRGCWDYPLLPEEYERFRGHELGGAGYYA